MSVYKVTSKTTIHRIDVGWSRDAHSYWYALYDLSGTDPEASPSDGLCASKGMKGELPTVYDLLRATWGYVEWRQEQATRRQLKEDPWLEERAWHEEQTRRRAATQGGPPGLVEL